MEEETEVHEKLLKKLEASGLPYRLLEHQSAETSQQSGT